jgi:DMSO reductase family type II enzyme chaperone
MSDLAYQVGNSQGPERRVAAERTGSEAPGRCLLYALFSDLAASPFDSEPSVAGEAIDLAELGLPYGTGALNELLTEWRNADRDVLKREYSGLFEVGSNGPPVPIREDLHRGQPAGVREDLVRFFDFFGYGLEESFAWAPDHLSVEFEFMHFLCYQEAEQAAADSGDALSFQLAQHDFAERHLCNWVPELAEKIHKVEPDGLYARLIAAISDCLLKDFEWQKSTINE